MKWAAYLMILILAGVCLIKPAYAWSIDEVLSRQEQSVGIDDLERAARNSGGIAGYGITLNDGIRDLLHLGSQEAGGILRKAVRSAVMLMVIVILCSFAGTMNEVAGQGKIPVVSLAGALAITAVAAVDVHAMLGLGRTTMEGMRSFANVLFPTVAAVTATTGAIAGAAARQMAAVFFSDLLINLIDRLLIPLLYGFLAVSVAYAGLGNDGLKRIAGFLKWGVTTLLTSVMLAFVGYLTVSGVVAGNVDAASIKATKFAISGTIPVVGGIISDAAETILASAGVLKGSVGVFGMITVLSICLVPLLRIAAHYLVYKLVAVVAATVEPGRVGDLIDKMGSAFGLMLGMAGASSLLLLVSLVTSLAAVTV